MVETTVSAAAMVSAPEVLKVTLNITVPVPTCCRLIPPAGQVPRKVLTESMAPALVAATVVPWRTRAP